MGKIESVKTFSGTKIPDFYGAEGSANQKFIVVTYYEALNIA